MKAILHLLWAMVVSIGVAYAEPTTRIGESYYYIEGASALILTGQMDNKGPVGADGRHHPALTRWEVQWRFRHNMQGDVCKMEKILVMVGVTAIRPRWRGEKTGSAALRDRWNQLVDAVDIYQAYHKQQALDAGTSIENALNDLAPTKTCEALTDAANQAATGILEQYKKASTEYDRATDYGRKNGVSLI